ncbi:fibronectin type III domain-containing protein [Curtobacterium sp. MCSS17_008]|uniref:Ig-like domain-containing protein n=1 Tax=Curtobacterium sp. MCSS17_008 TaxID=2175647 RepID=UPI000DA7660F|nr:Ig-like domain-containing protein [Curtobacterium sp. MCSS17_008]PZF59842.1 fibronectin type III domain-containing protein [Curtobacterium sp. MCSS17_008]
MIRTFLARHRSAAVSVGASVVVGAVVATAAVVSTGYHTQRVDLGDGTVWVPSAQYGAVGRANTGVLELNTAVETPGDDLSVLQRGADVYSVDGTKGTVSKVDVADATVGDAVTLPAGSPQVFLAGDTAIIGNGDTGEIWATPTADLADFDVATEADLTLGADAVFDTSDRHVAVYSPRTGRASLVDVATDLTVDRRWDVRFDRDHDFQVASFGDHVAVLDRTTGQLSVDGDTIDLGDRVGDAPALQRSSDASSDVVVAGTAGLVRVSASGQVDRTALRVSGRAARPAVVGTCTYAVWAGGQAMDSCRGSGLQQLARTADSEDLQIVHNGETVVANDPRSGRSWAIDRSGQLIDNWADLIEQDDEQQQERVSDDDPEVDKDQKPPVAVDDDLGARPGRTTSLPVLLNDHDPNGDPLVISDAGSVDEAAGSVAVVGDGQRLQITLADDARGTLSFPYTITDGNGGSDSATVRVTVRPGAENEPPRQVRSTSADVVQNGHVVTNVLSDWVDPDGDPVYLESATADGDQVSTTPDGMLDFRNASGRTGERSVQLVVSDGRDRGRGAMTVRVAEQGSVPLHADPFAVQGYAGKAFTVDPLEHVRGGNGTITLTSVSSAAGLTVTPAYDAGTFRVQGAGAGDHQLEYTVTDGTKTASGVVRVTVLAPPDASTPPITTPKTVFVNTLSTKDTDVTATDTDPAGGVLMVTALDGPEQASGVQADILDQHVVRVTLTAPLEGPVSFRYTESNGLATATGTITVVEIPKPDRIQPPVAQADTATVRVGDVTEIDVLANDTQPEGEPLTLDPDLVQNVPGDGGLLFVSGDRLRYLAPDTPGNHTAVYRVAGPDGQYADATVSISVRERDAATNNPPVPETVTARVVAGQSVRVTVPLVGIDPDGDSVQLVGVADNPDKGSVSDVTSDALTYDAGDYSAGTDEFSYTVVDAVGARATGTVRLGITPRAEQAANPVAEADHVTIRPGGSVTVRVLQNDSDPQGGQLSVAAAEPTAAGVTAEVLHRSQIRVTPPRSATEGDFAVLYTAANPSGGSSTAFLTVTVDRDAPPLRPEVDDTTLDLQDILRRQSVTVDVLRNVFFAEGSTARLRVGVVDGYGDTARVTADRRITVQLTDSSQVIPFSVARTDHPDVVSYGFVHVPGFDDALPQVDRSAGVVTVKSGATVRIPLDRYVVTANGRTAELTDRGTVKATHANGQDLVVDRSTLQFTSSKLYYGNASISFEVTDGSKANGGKGRVATLALPITVTPRSNQPPAFTGSTLDMQPGESRTIDLTKLTDYPYPDDVRELRYSVVSRPGSGTTATVQGQRLRITVAETARKGTAASIGVGVADDANAGRSGVVQVGVVGSTRPLVQPGADRAVVERGRTSTIDVLANDEPTNPFPDERLRVVAIRGLSGGLPPGVSVTPSADRTRLQVAVSGRAEPVDAHLQYQVADATDDPSRSVWGDVTISVQDVPDTPGAPSRTGTFQGGQATLSWSAPRANNAAITGYRIQGSNGVTKDCGTSTVCTITGLDPAASYRFSVIARNAVGDSDPSATSAPISADFVPAAPKGLRVAPSSATPNQLDVTWGAVNTPNGGSPVSNYVVSVDGPGLSTTRNAGTATNVSFSGAQSGAAYTVRVSARNAADRDGSPVQWNEASASGSAVGAPATPQLSATGEQSGATTAVTLRASESDWGGGGASWRIAKYASTTPVPSGCSTAGAVEVWNESTASDRISSQYRYVALASNGLFCTASQPASVQGYQTPDAPTGTIEAVQDGETSPNWDIRVTAKPTSEYLYYSVNGGAPVRFSGAASLGAGSGYGIQTSVVFTACATDGQYCASGGPVSDTAFTTRASVVSAVVGQAPVINPPDNNGRLVPEPEDYQISYCRPLLGCSDTNPATNAPWTTTDPVPEGSSSIRVKATVKGEQDPVGATKDVTTPDTGATDPPPGTGTSDPGAG